jgi:hypothetical protein
MLQQSLRFFVQAQFNNVGTNRALCGILLGTCLMLICAAVPLAVTFTRAHSRWWRLTAFPGLFLGSLTFLAALHGICMGVYLFGDLRQLHRFELSRPPISRPRPLSTSQQRSALSCAMSSPPISPPSSPTIPITQPPRLSVLPPPQAYLADRRRSTSNPTCASQRSSGHSSDFTCEAPSIGIEISNVMYDVDAVDGPAINFIAPESRFMAPPQADDGSFTTTATFIHPYDLSDDGDHQSLPEKARGMSTFDFDALPSRIYPRPTNYRQPQDYSGIKIEPKTSSYPPKSLFSPIELLTRFQETFSVKWDVFPEGRNAIDIEKQGHSRGSSFGLLGYHPPPQPIESKRATLRQQFRMIKAVPVFTDLTRVLSPIIVRGQWEIVVKSSMIGFVLTWTILGCLLAVPPQH